MKESDVEKLSNDHQSPWIWQSALALNGTPFWGIFASYWGGGECLNRDWLSYIYTRSTSRTESGTELTDAIGTQN